MEAMKGSQAYLRILINDKPELLIGEIRKAVGVKDLDIEFVSPLKECREKFLEKLGLDNLKKDLKKFWPKCGPQWDGLGREKCGNKVFLIEAKAHLGEIFSKIRAIDSESLELIKKSLSNIYPNYSENLPFYQYMNRVAHLYFLRKYKIEAYLIFIYFLNSPAFKDAPKTRTEWEAALYVQKRILVIKKEAREYIRDEYIKDIFIDVNDLE